jgi:hypothetical protein
MKPTFVAILMGAAIATGVVAAAVAPGLAYAADVAPGRIPTVTRLVKLFLDREEALSAAMRAGEMASLERTLTDDFELRTGALAANPVPRADFIAEVTRSRPASGAASRMAVHDLDAVAIVSFVQGEDPRTAVFVVDVWRRQGADWKLAVRYAGPAGTAAFTIPGAGAAAPEIPKKY